MIKDGLIQDTTIFGVPFRINLIPTSNVTSRPRTPMAPLTITVHNTGNTKKGADAEAHTKYVDNTTAYVSWHFTVDDKQIIQELPTNEIAWHAGDGAKGPGNLTSIAIEICENEGIDWPVARDNAIKLITYLLLDLNVPPNNVVPHQKWSGKYCPHIILDEGWAAFIQEVEDAWVAQDNSLDNVSAYAKVAWSKAVRAGVNDGIGPKNTVTEEQLMVFFDKLGLLG